MAAQQVGELSKVADLKCRLGAVFRASLTLSVHPDDGNVQAAGRHDIMKIALGRMELSSLTQTPTPLFEMRRAGFVGSNLFGGHDQLETGGEVTERRIQQPIIDVRKNTEPVSAGEPFERRVRIGKWKPFGQTRRKKVGPVRSDRPTEP